MKNGAYYLGKTKTGYKVYLEKPSWDCGWYWGFGYLNFYNLKGRPTLQIFTHWDTIVKESNTDAHSAIKDLFKQLTISDDKLWKLCDYMKSFYTLKSMSNLVYCGGSNYTSNLDVKLKDDTLYQKINKEMLPAIFEAIDNLFNKECDN